MSKEENLNLVRRFFEEVANGRRDDLAESLLTQDHRYIDPQRPDVQPGPAETVRALKDYQNGVEGHWQIDDIFAADDDRVVVLWTGTGRHTGEISGIPPTGRSIRVSAISVMKIRDGKIAEHRCNWDTLGFLQQLGVVPMPMDRAA